MKDLDSIKLKSEENDNLKDNKGLSFIKKDNFPKINILNNIFQFGVKHFFNISLLS